VGGLTPAHRMLWTAGEGHWFPAAMRGIDHHSHPLLLADPGLGLGLELGSASPSPADGLTGRCRPCSDMGDAQGGAWGWARVSRVCSESVPGGETVAISVARASGHVKVRAAPTEVGGDKDARWAGRRMRATDKPQGKGWGGNENPGCRRKSLLVC